jgi:hypothetical protein
MSQSPLETFATHELKYQARKQISQEIRDRCPKGDPMVTNVTVMLGTILAMAVFSAMLKGSSGGRTR